MKAVALIARIALGLVLRPQAERSASVPRGSRVARPTVACAAAMQIVLPNARVTEVRAEVPNDSLRALGQRAHCRIAATIDSEIQIVALLPDDWNGQFVMGGAGGYAGAPDNQSEATVQQGYATGGTDAGHVAFSMSAQWALHDDQRIVNYAHRAVHRTAEVTKLLIAAYYGRSRWREGCRDCLCH